jgi:hypothetical protein
VVGFLSRSYFFVGSRFTCVVSRMCIYLSVSWIPDMVSFLSRSYFFPGPRFTCVVSRMCTRDPVKYSCRRHFLVCLAQCCCEAFSYQVSIPPPPFYRSWFSFVVRLIFFCLLHTLFYNMLPLFIGDPTSVLSVSWIPVVVGFLLRSHFFPGPKFTCVVSRSLHALFYNMLPLFIRDLACVYLYFMDLRCGKFPFKILFLSRSWDHMCGKSHVCWRPS